jgi:type I restriction enzyme M protein
MLDSDTKRRIDTCRDILVGKVPDPKSQVEQITVALIYKFMDDMDLESEEFGGERKFFTKEYERYRWAKLVAPGVSGQDMLNTYSEALTKMVENEGLPPLFRTIFRNAYLPYRDPETLRSFLREINGFTYDHSERLGDAFEYLLSVLGSQGDAGQFRTPRHIIDFMVEVIDPKKNEVVLDPACGTAGFLISAYKHVLKANSTGVVAADGDRQEADAAELALESPLRFPGDLLTPEDRTRLAHNIKGYDISPDMVRLSLVNLYLHGFADPKIEEYDTLTSEEKWTETADVILANPPFMSPKGGIKPHTRFRVQSKRSEVLFVDYIAEHLTPQGRAAIIVPEGILFQSQTTYVDLRKMLVDNFLAAVVSLPAGVFNPYSGVKTSILILDRAVAKASQHVAFFKIENDGFALGAQRKAQKGGQLPYAKAELSSWLESARSGNGEGLSSPLGFSVERAQLENGQDYNLSGDRYRAIDEKVSRWPIVTIGTVCEIARGASPRPIDEYMTDGPEGINWIKIGDALPGAKYITSTKGRISPEGAKKSRYVKPGDFILSNSMSFGRPYIMATDGCIHDGWLHLRIKDPERVDKDYLYQILGSSIVYEQFLRQATGGVVNNLNSGIVAGVEIALPPLNVQREIVAEIEGYQRVIDGARTMIKSYRPHVPVEPDWPKISLGDLCKFVSGGTPSKSNEEFWSGPIPWISAKDLKVEKISDAALHISEAAVAQSAVQIAPIGALLVLVRGMGLANGFPICEVAAPCAFNQDIKALIPNRHLIDPAFLAHSLRQNPAGFERSLETAAHGTLKLNSNIIKDIEVSVPPLSDQLDIVKEISTEQAIIEQSRDLVVRFEKKIGAAIARVWGEAIADAEGA